MDSFLLDLPMLSEPSPTSSLVSKPFTFISNESESLTLALNESELVMNQKY